MNEFEPFLYDYQRDALKRMRNGCILNGGVGSGKSRTGLCYYFEQQGGSMDIPIKAMYKPKDLYIITTAMKRDSFEFEEELAPFTLSPDPELNGYSNRVVIDSWNNIGKYVDVSGAFFIFDEDHVTGYGAWVKAFLKLAKKNDWIILSATPGDSWEQYIPVFVANGFYKNKTEFVQEHVIYAYNSKYPKIQSYRNTGRLIRLRNNILVDMDFTRKTIRHNEDVYVDFDKQQHRKIIVDRWDPIKDEPIKSPSELCYALRRLVNSDESRQVKLLELLDDHPKAIIFYNFDYERDILLNLGYASGTEVAEWNGHAHQPIPRSDKWVYVVQYTSGCEGWNCTDTDTIIFYSQNYSYKTIEQACGRIDRLNTPYTDLYYYHFRSRSGIDLAIHRAILQKKKFNEGSWASKTTRF